jgi:hypothetical protein
MKKLLKLPLLLITLLLIFSCGRNAEDDVNTLRDAVERLRVVFNEEDTKENLEEKLEIFLEIEEILSYYANDANSDKTLSFIRIMSDVREFNDTVDDREDLKEELDDIRDEIEEIKEELDEM